MTEAKRVPLYEADFPSLKAFAEIVLGIEVKQGTNSSQLTAKIATAAPGVKDIPVVEASAPAEPAAPTPRAAEGEDPAARPAAVTLPASKALMHQCDDPRVELTVHKTADKHRAKDVTISVNGVTTRFKRGERVDVPFRIYEALNNAVEKTAVPTDDINPLTGEPVMGWEDIHSYPFTVHKMPDEQAIAAWHQATDVGFQQPLAPTQLAA